jgi:hypothetical protein
VLAPSRSTVGTAGGTTLFGSDITVTPGTFPEGTVTLNANLTIPQGAAFTVPQGWMLVTINGSLTNNGAVINNGTIDGNLTNNGTVINNGTIYGEIGGAGNFINNGTQYNSDNAAGVDLTMTSSASGDGWSYNRATKVFTVQNNANVAFTGITTENRIAVASGAAATVTLDWARINLTGSGTENAAFDLGDGAAVTLLLTGTNNLISGGAYPGIHAPAGTTLVIDSAASSNAGTEQSGRSVSGSLTVTAGNTSSNNSSNGAGIGSRGFNAAGTITIYGGTINARGGYNGAGIGGGNYGSVGTLRIKGGTVVATGGTYGPGIGPGAGLADTSGSVTISGGTVTAAGGQYGAGIGGGYYGSVSVTISGGSGTAVGTDGGHSVGPGRSGSGGTYLGPNWEISWPTANPYTW